ncbi:MAG: HAMP domain-containing protein, partial [Micromonosporaceae bacterium]|nr:HAMP domain-containing protein [Micromonosporaceae bacterium]
MRGDWGLPASLRAPGRWGLRAKMTASYVLVTAAAVLVVEVVLIGVTVPWLSRVAPENPGAIKGTKVATDLISGSTVSVTAVDYAARAAIRASQLGHLPGPGELRLGDPAAAPAPDRAQLTASGTEVVIPFVTDGRTATSVALLLTPDNRVLDSSDPVEHPVGQHFSLPVPSTKQGADAGSPLAAKHAVVTLPTGEVAWAVAPVINYGPAAGTGESNYPVVYVQAPLVDLAAAGVPPARATSFVHDVLLPRLGISLLVLLGVLAVATPVGVVFGLLATRGLRTRLRRLASSTAAVAGGDFHHRVPVSGADEVTQLERGFNQMAERLAGAMEAERRLAGADERGRIARELHDSISQDLFSLRLLAAGLRRALPAGSPLHGQVQTMEQTATDTLHEMRALLLELRPVALAEAGLGAALGELCQAYRDRLGIAVECDVRPVTLEAPVEHAL